MSPRNRQDNEEIREKRREQILDAAMSVYIDQGYNGSDVDQVAETAGLAKGLIYYYFKTKQELFRAMFDWALDHLMDINNNLMVMDSTVSDPFEKFLLYIVRVFNLAESDLRTIRFAMRLPFDAFTIFGSKEWKKGMERSSVFMSSMAMFISNMVKSGIIPEVDAFFAANSFWAVFVMNFFNINRMIGAGKNKDTASIKDNGKLKKVITFCFLGLGINRKVLEKYLNKIKEKA